MSVGQRTQPGIQSVNGEADIANLIPGDRVPVVLEHGQPHKWMAYGGHTPTDLKYFRLCIFIGIPEGYKGQDVYSFDVWESYQPFLQFPGNHIEFNHFYSQLRIAGLGSEEYDSVKTLVDMLIE